MLLDKLDGVGADRQVKWRLSLRCDFNKQAAESVRIALLDERRRFENRRGLV